MHSLNFTGRENRLCYRLAEDVNSKVRYTSRVADANASRQEMQRAQNQLANGAPLTTTTSAGQQALQDMQSRAAGVEFNAVQSGTRTGPSAADILDQASISSQGIRTNFNQTTGNIQSDNTRVNTGQIDEAARERLIASGMTPEQAELSIQQNRGDVQGAFNQVGTNSAVDPAEQPPAFFGQWGNPQDMAANQQLQNERLRGQQITQQGEQDRADRSAMSSAASTAASANSNEQGMQSTVQDSGNLDRASTILDGLIAATGDPMGQVYKEMLLQDMQDAEDAKMNAGLSLDASVDRANDQYDDVTSLIDKYAKLHADNHDKTVELLDQTRDSQLEYLAEQEERDMNKLTWEADRAEEKMAKQKTDQLLKQSIQNALGGGAFSGAASEQLASTEREWDSAIANLAKEYSFKQTDVSAFYKQKYIDTNNQFNLEVHNAAKQLDSVIEGYAIQGFNSLQARENAITQAENDYRTTIDEAKKTYSESLKGYISEIRETMVEERRAKRAEEKAAEDREWQERKFYENMDYQYSKQEATEKRNALKMEKADEKLVRTDFTKVNESPTVKDYVAIRNATAKAQNVLLDAVASGGRLDKSIATEVTTVLYEKGLDPTSVVREGEYLRAALGQSVYDKGKKALEMLTGGDATGITSDMVEAMQRVMDSMTRTQREAAQAEYIGPINRMVEFNATSESININPATLTLPAGIQIPEWATKAYFEDQESTGGTSFEVNWDDESSWDAGGGESDFGDTLVSLGRTTQDFNTPIASKENGGLYAASTVQAWGGKHAGLDLAVPQGTKFSSLIDGEIVDFGYTDGWGGTVVVRDSRGAEHRISHLSELSPELQKGAKIKKGQVIAKTGGERGTKGAGNSTGAHIDYRVRYQGNYVDPLTYSPA